MVDVLGFAFVAVLVVQVVLWVAMEVDVRRHGLTHVKWFAVAALIVPVVGLGVSIWYFANRRELRNDDRVQGDSR